MTELTIEQEESIRKAAIIAVTERIAELQRSSGRADAPERIEMLRKLLTKLESSNGGAGADIPQLGNGK